MPVLCITTLAQQQARLKADVAPFNSNKISELSLSAGFQYYSTSKQ